MTARVGVGHSAVPWWRRLWRFIDRWTLHILIGFPLTMGFLSSGDTMNEYSDFYAVARTAPRYELSGLIAEQGRGKARRMVVHHAGGTTGFVCSPVSRRGCYDAWPEPFRGTVRLFDYKGRRVVLTIRRADGSYIGADRSDGRYVATEKERLNDIRLESEWFTRDTFWENQKNSFQISFTMAVIGSLILFYSRRARERRQARSGAAVAALPER